jgi:hypothetical protein
VASVAKEPGSGLLGPLAPELMQAEAEALEPGSAGYLRIIPGDRDCHAVVDDENTDVAWAQCLAENLSAKHRGRFYAFANNPDYYWLIITENGETLYDDEGAVHNYARDLGCPIV